MKSKLMIVCNDKDKTLTLCLPNNLKGIIIGPYLAMYKYIHEDYKWTNWSDWYEEEIKLESLKAGTAQLFSESYVNSLIINGEVDEYILSDIIEEMGYMPDYIFLLENEEVELVNIEHKDYDSGKGAYFYDKQNFRGADEIKPDLIYKGEYLRCILDKKNNIKSGHINSDEQEILIPFHIKI